MMHERAVAQDPSALQDVFSEAQLAPHRSLPQSASHETSVLNVFLSLMLRPERQSA